MPARNIVLFMTDDQGWGDLGCYGHPSIQSPELDTFARRSLLLTDCHASSAVCSPSRAGLLTGRTPFRNGVHTICSQQQPIPYLRREELTLPSILKQHGYRTCHVGKWHLGTVAADGDLPGPHQHGYDHYLATVSAAKPNHLDPTNFVRNGTACGRIAGNSAGIIVDEAIDWLGQRPWEEAPFFLTVWTHEPHTPIGTEARFRERYDADLPQKKRDYYGNITQIDAAFGKLIAHLDATGMWEDTIVLYTSDNGPAWDPEFLNLGSTGGHRGAKAWLYEGGHRVPGLLHWPGRSSPGSVSHATVFNTDFFPSILTGLGIPLPTDRVIDGTDILPIFDGQTPERPQPLYWRYEAADNDLKVAYREGDWVLLADTLIDRCELYHLGRDWQQRDNRVYDEYERFAAMKRRLLTVHRAVDQDGPGWWRNHEDPNTAWKQNHPEGITRHLQGALPEPAPEPYPPATI
ncbi:MAG: sulfatase [Planctomycetota bacterium]